MGAPRKFFPPVDEQTSAMTADDEEEAQSEKLAKSMPDAPKDQPREEGQPDAKKQKFGLDDDEGDAEWETVEKPETEASNGIENDNAGAEETEAKIAESEKAEEVATALHTTEMGGSPPKNMLEKDW